MWLYEVGTLTAALAIFALLFSVSYLGYRLGAGARAEVPEKSPRYLAESVPRTVLGLLALILGFTFSMTISRFEKRRSLVIAEANEIESAYMRTGLLRSPRRKELAALLRLYLDERIAHYGAPVGSAEALKIDDRSTSLQEKLWDTAIQATQTDRGAIENSFILSLRSMSDLRNERNIALKKPLPAMIYWSILLISGVGLAAFNFVRSERGEIGQWQPSILIAMISFFFFLILDLERPTDGTIGISQEAMIATRESIHRR